MVRVSFSSLARTRSSPFLPSTRFSGGAGDCTAWMIASAARIGSPGCLP
jgi:hypothetical protein